MALLAAVAVCAIIKAWDPPLHWRTGMTPTRYVTARVEFKKEEVEKTAQARLKARDETKAIFTQDTRPLEQLRADLRNTVAELTKTETLTEKTASIWKEFQTPAEKAVKEPKPQAELAGFPEFRKALAGKENLEQLDRVVAEAFAPLEQRGLLADLTQSLKGYNKKTILAHSAENPAERREVEVSDVTIDPQAIRQRGRGTQLEDDCRPNLRLARPAAPQSVQAVDHLYARRRGEQGGPGGERRQRRTVHDPLPRG